MRAKLLLVILFVSLFTIPAAAETTGTNHVIEWRQHLFSRTNQTVQTFPNTTFTIDTPHNWTHVSGRSFIHVSGYARAVGGVASPTGWAPTLKLDNSAARLDGACSPTYFQFAAGDTQPRTVTIDLLCPVTTASTTPDYLLDGSTHGILMTADAGTPANVRYTMHFYAVQFETVLFTQPGSTIQFNRHENTSNVTLANQTAAVNMFNTLLISIADSIDQSTLIFVAVLITIGLVIWAERSKEWLIYLFAVVAMIPIVLNLDMDLDPYRIVPVGIALMLALRGIYYYDANKTLEEDED